MYQVIKHLLKKAIQNSLFLVALLTLVITGPNWADLSWRKWRQQPGRAG